MTEPRAMTWAHWLANQAAARVMECVGTVRLLDLPELLHESRGDGTVYWLKGLAVSSPRVFYNDKAWYTRSEIYTDLITQMWPNVTFILPE